MDGKLEEVRRVLVRAVSRIAPSWLANERDDIVQAALMRLIKISDGEESEPRTASYLWKVAHSSVMDEIRRRQRRPESSLEDQPAAATASQSSGADQESYETWTTINSGLQTLSEPRRRAVLLYLMGYTMQESAKILGCTTKQLDNQRYRGLADLRSYLTEKGFHP